MKFILYAENRKTQIHIEAMGPRDAMEEAAKFMSEIAAGKATEQLCSVAMEFTLESDDWKSGQISIFAEPDEPDCSGEEHEWEADGVTKDGGVSESCQVCTLRRQVGHFEAGVRGIAYYRKEIE